MPKLRFDFIIFILLLKPLTANASGSITTNQCASINGSPTQVSIVIEDHYDETGKWVESLAQLNEIPIKDKVEVNIIDDPQMPEVFWIKTWSTASFKVVGHIDKIKPTRNFEAKYYVPGTETPIWLSCVF